MKPLASVNHRLESLIRENNRMMQSIIDKSVENRQYLASKLAGIQNRQAMIQLVTAAIQLLENIGLVNEPNESPKTVSFLFHTRQMRVQVHHFCPQQTC